MPAEESEGTGRALQHRVIVRGHWRHQPCGPNRSERRSVWIDQHLRGPETAPIKGPNASTSAARRNSPELPTAERSRPSHTSTEYGLTAH
ncbi:hypothetical protein GCM10029992_36590 [Glycomyces albus]